MFGNQSVYGRIAQGNGQAMRTPNCEELPRRTGEAQEQRDEAAQADGGHEGAFQAEAVADPTQQRLQHHGHSAVESDQNANLTETEPQMPGVERQGEADQAEAEAREQTLAHDGEQRYVDPGLHHENALPLM